MPVAEMEGALRFMCNGLAVPVASDRDRNHTGGDLRMEIAQDGGSNPPLSLLIRRADTALPIHAAVARRAHMKMPYPGPVSPFGAAPGKR